MIAMPADCPYVLLDCRVSDQDHNAGYLPVLIEREALVRRCLPGFDQAGDDYNEVFNSETSADLRVDTAEFNAMIKRAAERLQDFKYTTERAFISVYNNCVVAIAAPRN